MIIRIGKNSMMAANLGKEILENCGIVIYPTETSYGLGCKFNCKNAIKKIFQIKKRGKDKKLPVIVASKKMAYDFFELNQDARKLVNKFMPGPLTLIVNGKKRMPKEIGETKVAFRISSNKFACELSRAINCPVISTSANLSGRENIYAEKELFAFDKHVDLIFTAGNLKNKKPSTIYDTTENKIIRQGLIKKEMIEKALKKKIF
ncbi:MAG: L-threonylcarbamoyladenylate synthase [archaeon]